MARAQTTLGVGGDLTEIAFDGAPGAKLDDVVGAVKRGSPGLDVQSWETLSPLAYTMETFSKSYVAVWLMVMFVLMAIGIVNTQLMAVFERTREFGLMQALGMRPGLIVAQVMLESALLIGLGVAAGCGLMVLTLLPMMHGLDLGSMGAASEMAGASSILYPVLDAHDTLVVALVVWTLGVVVTLWPSANREDQSDRRHGSTQWRSTMAGIIECRGVEKDLSSGRGGRAGATAGVDLDIEAGDFATLSGPSGSGKTTLLSLIGGLDRPTAGQISVDGAPIAGMDKNHLSDLRLHKIGFVFQTYSLVPVLSAAENVEFILRLLDLPKAERGRRGRSEVLARGRPGRTGGPSAGAPLRRPATARRCRARSGAQADDRARRRADGEPRHEQRRGSD